MILGIGLDAVEIRRVDAFRARRGEHGLRRLFTAAELEYCLGMAQPAASLAARFAAKEAFFKALGTGWRWGRAGAWTDVEVVRDHAGRPRLQLHGTAALRARELGASRSHLSLTHTARLALAHVMLET